MVCVLSNIKFIATFCFSTIQPHESTSTFAQHLPNIHFCNSSSFTAVVHTLCRTHVQYITIECVLLTCQTTHFHTRKKKEMEMTKPFSESIPNCHIIHHRAELFYAATTEHIKNIG